MSTTNMSLQYITNQERHLKFDVNLKSSSDGFLLVIFLKIVSLCLQKYSSFEDLVCFWK